MRLALAGLAGALLLVGCGEPKCDATTVLRARIGDVHYAVPVALQPTQGAYPTSRAVRTEHGYENGRGRYLYCQRQSGPEADLSALMFKARTPGAIEAGQQTLPRGLLLISLTGGPGTGRAPKAGGDGAPLLFGRPVATRCPPESGQCRLRGVTPEGLTIQVDVDVKAAPRETWPALFKRLEAFERGLRAPA